MHQGRAIFDDNYFNTEVYLNNLKKVSINSSTEYALGVAVVDASGTQITSFGSSQGSSVVSGTTTVATAGTPQRITATPTTIKGVWISADLIAGIVVTVGDSSVVGNVTGMKGVVLIPGNAPIFLQITDLSLLYVDAQSNGGKLAWLYTA